MSTAQKSKLSPEQFQAISRALAEPRRYAILQQIAQQPTMMCSCLPERECISPATLSHHMKELQEANLIEVEREGRGMKLRLRREVWDDYLHDLASL